MLSDVIALLRANRGLTVDLLAARIVETIPRYSLADPAVLRESVDGFFDDILDLSELGDRASLSTRLMDVAKKRLDQGFTPSDFLRAIFLVFPVVREVLRRVAPPADPGLARGFSELELVLFEACATAADVLLTTASRRLESKNLELNRLNQRLAAQEKVLSLEVREASRALQSANEYNRRVIESLSSGVMVTDAKTRTVTLYSRRMEEITGLPAEKVLGRSIFEAFAELGGLDTAALFKQVEEQGRVPLTKLQLTLPNGRKRWVYLQVQRVFDEDGEAEGGVVVLDDITERELLLGSFSRYVSRDLVARLLARGESLGLEGERRVVTTLFADIRGFTTIAEQLTPEALHQVLNRYFEGMIAGITGNGGFIDKFIGDKVMALFESRDPAEGALAAVRAARAIQARLGGLTVEVPGRGTVPVRAGIGVNTGEVLVGNVGSQERMDFTAIGDAVNVADRLQALAREGETLLGPESARLAAARGVAVVDRGEQPLKGREAKVRVFALG